MVKYNILGGKPPSFASGLDIGCEKWKDLWKEQYGGYVTRFDGKKESTLVLCCLLNTPNKMSSSSESYRCKLQSTHINREVWTHTKLTHSLAVRGDQ